MWMGNETAGDTMFDLFFDDGDRCTHRAPRLAGTHALLEKLDDVSKDPFSSFTVDFGAVQRWAESAKPGDSLSDPWGITVYCTTGKELDL